ncbi:MAG: pyrroloquinoline-quinone synthase PqqC [Silvibacterium sp.]|nr:pyrroloquinoline-quinone synthase PqqC [Silvibacterium sp.]
MSTISSDVLLSTEELRARLVAVGQERYHHKHPFHLLMHEGRLTRSQMQAWALNRYYYQSQIPVKDAIILSRSNDAVFRRSWRKRIVDHDGVDGQPGGIEKWLRLAEATGLTAARVLSTAEILPGVRYAVDAYLQLVGQRSPLEAVASSLTEMFSRDLISLRLDALRQHYPWLESGLAYFTARLTQAPEDAEFAFDWVASHAGTREDQELAIGALKDKCAILWAQLDALYYSYIEPGWPPPGAFRMETA